MIVRPAAPHDVHAVQAIYAWHVLHGTASFEFVPPTPAEMAERMAAVVERGLPWRVAEAEGRLVAYAYASPFRLRTAYRYTAEDSVYVAHDHLRRGAGRAVLVSVIEACEAMGFRQLIGGIGGSDNAGSVALHAALGFEQVGLTPAVGYKFGRWCDVIWMQKALNGGASSAPEGGGLEL